jgi:hypothetical protein
MQAFLNMRSSSSHADADFRPKSWREKILRLYPNGSVSLTALTSLMPSESVDDPQYHWFDKGLPSQAGTVTAIYTDAARSSAYASGAVLGAILYLVVTEDASGASQFRVGHQVLLRDASDQTVDVNAKVIEVQKGATTTTYLTVKLLEADDNSTLHDLSDCDRVLIIGNINPEGSEMPDSISYDPTKHYNYTQIFRSSLSLTRTRMRTKVRYGTTSYQEAKRDCLELHGLELEKAFLWSIPTEGTGANGQPERTTGGLYYHIPTANKSMYTSDTDFTGQTWLAGGIDWMNKWLEVSFRYGPKTRTAYCGTGTILAINKLIENRGDFVFTTKTVAYGINIMQWITPFGQIDMYVHPLFSHESTNRKSMLLFCPEFIRYRYVDDTYYQKDDRMKEGTWVNVDGIKEGYLTECGLEIYHTDTLMSLWGFGEDA